MRAARFIPHLSQKSTSSDYNTATVWDAVRKKKEACGRYTSADCPKKTRGFQQECCVFATGIFKSGLWLFLSY
jgi:hypothetical protein